MATKLIYLSFILGAPYPLPSPSNHDPRRGTATPNDQPPERDSAPSSTYDLLVSTTPSLYQVIRTSRKLSPVTFDSQEECGRKTSLARVQTEEAATLSGDSPPRTDQPKGWPPPSIPWRALKPLRVRTGTLGEWRPRDRIALRVDTVPVGLWRLERVPEENSLCGRREGDRSARQERSDLRLRCTRSQDSACHRFRTRCQPWLILPKNCGIAMVTRSLAVRGRQESERPGIVEARLQAHAFVVSNGLKDESAAQLHLPGIG